MLYALCGGIIISVMEKAKESTKEKRLAKKKAKKAVEFSSFICFVFLVLTRIVRFFFLHGRGRKSKAFKKEFKKGAMLILSNHLSAYDFISFSAPLFGHKVNFVVAENMMFATPIFAKLINMYHAIPKRQYFADYQCIKMIKKNLDAGISVVLCPEGKVSADGKTGVIAESTARLVEWLGYPVAVCKLEGASFVRPKWAYNKRNGRNYASYDMLFTKEEVETLSKKEIYHRIVKALDHNEHLWQKETGIAFKGDRYAEGLERLLYVCPKCHKEFTLTTKGDEMTCTACGNHIRYAHTGELLPLDENSVTFERIDLWYDFERELVREQVKDASFRLEDKVKLFIENEERNGYRYIADGSISLDHEWFEWNADGDTRLKNVQPEFKVNNLDFEAEGSEREPIEEEFKHLRFNIVKCDTIATQPGTLLDFYDENHTYRFMLKGRLSATKYMLAVESMFENRTV